MTIHIGGREISVLSLIAVLLFAAILSACGNDDNQNQTAGASNIKQVTSVDFDVPLNANGHTVEQQQILDRLKVTTDPTRLMWIHLISLDGEVIERLPVRNKVTSSGKRLEPLTAADDNQGFPRFGRFDTAEFIQADGTFGQSDNYIFWFDPLGRYNQYGTQGGIGYLLTDYPIDLTDPQDLITGLYRADQAATQWQQDQERTLCQQEPNQRNGERCQTLINNQ